MLPMKLPPAPPVKRAIRRCAAVAVVMLVSAMFLAPTRAGAAGSGSLKLAPGSSAWASVGSKRVSTIASASFTVPDSAPVRLGFQLRAGSHSSGYRVAVEVARDGTVSGSFSRVGSGTSTALGTLTALGFTAAPGTVVRVEAAVTSLRSVKLYLRAWPEGTIKPPQWQLSASDASSQRFRHSGHTYLWAAPDSTADAAVLAFGALTASSYTAARARATGVVPPEPNDDTFSIAVLPDTQAETNNPANTPFMSRVDWLVDNESRFDLRYALHTGDMVNWGWLDGAEYTRATAAIAVLAKAGIPYALTIGNHDTRAVGWNGIPGSTGYGGDAYMYNPECPTRLTAAQCKSWLLVRHTEEFNKAFPLDTMGGVGGAYEAGRVDNYWTSFTANGTSWLVLTLELWPRPEVVDWAGSVVASHPTSNVIIQTHNYLSSSGKIGTSNGGYGATSPSYLYSKVVSRYANVKLVFSGHTGGFRSRTDSPHGNTVVSFLGNTLGTSSNPVRVVTINTRTGQVSSAVYDPLHARSLDATLDRITLVR